MQPTPKPTPNGFTLVEMAIVLVIIGLLVGAVFVGQALIKNSQLQSVISDYSKYKSVTLQFKKQYGGLPGDIIDATDYWGIDPTTPTGCTGSGVATGLGTCNGNGDGVFEVALVASATSEEFQFWKQLSLAGLITGNYTGIGGAGGTRQAIATTNVPASRLRNAAWMAGSSTGGGWPNAGGDATSYALDYGNYLSIGGVTANSANSNPLLTPQEAWDIDIKLDDGMPGTGTVIASHWSSCATSASDADFTGHYKLTDNNAECTLFFVQQF